MKNNILHPDFLFEISWEVCNKIGGIYTVLSTKSNLLNNVFSDKHIYIGPDVWMETSETPGFITDENIYAPWVKKAHDDGLKFRIGRWNIPGNPIAILVELNQYFAKKNNIFAEYWEKYKLDSISGQWDYIEPAIFGYASGKIIESFYNFYVSAEDNIVAQFHEWMSGMGVLYLKDKIPQIATVFTSHATILGRSIASNGNALYNELSNNNINSQKIANNLNLTAKFSLERLSILHSDEFTTVSELTASEANKFYGRQANSPLLYNGFNRVLAPSLEDCKDKRKVARDIILKVASEKLNTNFDDNTNIALTSGRYEFRNKGIDLFLDSLNKIDKSDGDTNILALFAIPADSGNPTKEYNNKLLTHTIRHPENDKILNSCKRLGLNNDENNKVKVLFIPVYLNGNDGVFNLEYYDFLLGADLTVFVSYYEPWGYTPLESIAHGIPSVTTTLAGFGLYAKRFCNNILEGLEVIERNDNNYNEALDNLYNVILKYFNSSKDQKENATKKAFELSNNFLWDKLLDNYYEIYNQAIKESEKRANLYKNKIQTPSISDTDVYISESDCTPLWRKIYVNQELPKSLSALKEISNNLWWSWNYNAIELFESINKEKWEKYNKNPITLLNSLSSKEFEKLEKDKNFISKLNVVYTEFQEYINQPKKSENSIAYFSMEYGLENNLKIYSGGLGVLAGDYLKEMSDQNQNVIAIGLLYKYGYLSQKLSPFGDQININELQNYNQLPVNQVKNKDGEQVYIKIALPARTMYAKAWVVNVGRIPLYLLDTDIELNRDDDRNVTYQLYGGDNENRFKQELLLGVGGVRLLRQINLYPTIYHLNEGHAAFAGLERLREYVQDKRLTFHQSMELVRSSALFTTHTSVPAGHDAFPEDLLRTYIPHYPARIGCTWEKLMSLGKVNPNNKNEKISMSLLAIRTCQEVNGVSKDHCKVTQNMFSNLYKGFYPNELYISYVTNGVHYPTWTAKEWQKLHKNTFGSSFINNQSDEYYWNNIYSVNDAEIWQTKNVLRKKLIDYLKVRLQSEMQSRSESPKYILKVNKTLSENKLTIGFARRFATYKRAHLLFKNLDRLSKIVNNPDFPVQFLFSGKAHPADKAGQDLIKKIIEISRKEEFIGKIVFIENYDMELSKILIPGCDVWLNTPTRPLEASGTSGMKAVMNGTLNLSVLDGWWIEGYQRDSGWALMKEKTYTNQEYQDILDSETIYLLLENEIIPSFYERDNNNIPNKWTYYIKNNFAKIAPHFTMSRMGNDYFRKFYNKLIERTILFNKDNFSKAEEYAIWKKQIKYSWNNIEVVNINIPHNKVFKTGDKFEVSITLQINGYKPDNLAIDVILNNNKNKDSENNYSYKYKMKFCEQIGNTVKYKISEIIQNPGVFDIAIRVRPNNELMPYIQDLSLVKYI
ncbi:MAG: alpha-glucan family phosphorylase [Bacteroidales bacterium]